MKPRYLISTRRTGLGDRLVSLAAAWRLARISGRSLVADWRFSHYTPRAEANLFASCFEPAPTLAGVPFIGDDDVARLGLPGKPQRTLMEAIRHRLTGCRRLSATEALRAIHEGRDVPARAILLDDCIPDGSMPVEEARRFLSGLRPQPQIAEAVSRFRTTLGAGPVIGLHVRHGNGGDIMAHTPYWVSFDEALNRCVRAVEAARGLLGQQANVLLCTDSQEVERALSARIRHLISRSKLYRNPGEGELHRWRFAGLTFADAMTEMLLLAETDILIRYPPGSFFSFYGAVMKRRPRDEPQLVVDLQKPWDANDALSPALLF